MLTVRLAAPASPATAADFGGIAPACTAAAMSSRVLTVFLALRSSFFESLSCPCISWQRAVRACACIKTAALQVLPGINGHGQMFAANYLLWVPQIVHHHESIRTDSMLSQ